MNVLYVMQTLLTGGASYAAIDLAKGIRRKYPHISIEFFTSEVKKEHLDILSKEVTIHVGTAKQLHDLQSTGKFDLIHWFRTDKNTLLLEFSKISNPTCPVLMTLCQVPTQFELMLSPKEFSLSSKVIFICKAADDHWLHRWISSDQRAMIYFGSEIPPARPEKAKSERIQLGRGSTLNKCPNTLIKVYKKIKRENTTFLIAGEGVKDRLEKDIRKYGLEKSVHLVGHKDREEWLDFINELDIFFYYLPKDSYSAIDRTMQDAMLANKPVVYLGPEAPAELIDHGKTGFVAHDEKDLIKYLRKLIDDGTLRQKMGERGRNKIENEFNHDLTVDKYVKEYEKLLESKETTFLKVAANYYLLFKVMALKSFIRWKYLGLKEKVNRLKLR